MSAVHQIEWLNENSLRAYPLSENSIRRPINSAGQYTTHRLPDFLIVDMVLMVPTTTLFNVYLSRVALVGSSLSLVFSDAATADAVTSLMVDLTQHTAYQSYMLHGLADYDTTRGIVTLGDLGTNGAMLKNSLADGQYDFNIAGGLLEATVIRPSIVGISSLRLDNAGQLSDRIFDDVTLVAGSNIEFSYDPDTNTIRIDAVNTGNLSDECECEGEEEECITSINGLTVAPTIVGDGSSILVETDAGTNTITITDLASKPCCSCPELEFLTQQLKILEASLNTLQSYADQLNSKIEDFVTKYVLTVGSP